jgi:hypothetical protein
MDTKIAELLKGLAQLPLNNAPREEILAKAREIKVYLQRLREDLGKATSFVDSTINAFVPDADWENGLPTERIKTPLPSSPSPSKTRAGAVAIASPERILEVTRKKFPDGKVETKPIIAQLQAEGDTRPYSDIAKSVGNTLNRNGYERIETGRYERTKK